MRSHQIVKFKRLFEEQLKKLSKRASVPIEGFGVSPEETIDVLDHARDQAEQFVRMEIHNREQDVLAKIRQALQRIHAGVFGICIECEGDIEIKRLEAKPTANLCLECQKAHEDDPAYALRTGGARFRPIRLQVKPA